MKKIFLGIVLGCAITVPVVGCAGGYDMVDTVYSYDRAIIDLRNGQTAEVYVDSWRDYEDGEQLQITATDGTVYLTSSYNCTLIKY